MHKGRVIFAEEQRNENGNLTSISFHTLRDHIKAKYHYLIIII